MYEWTEAQMKQHAAWRETLITQSYKDHIARQSNTIRLQNETISEQQELILKEDKKYIDQFVSEKLSEMIVKTIHDALRLNYMKRMDEIISINVPISSLRMKTPHEMENELVAKYLMKIKSNLNFGVSKRPTMQGYRTYYRFSIPALSVEIEKTEIK